MSEAAQTSADGVVSAQQNAARRATQEIEGGKQPICTMTLTKLAKLTAEMARNLNCNYLHAFMDLLDASCEDEEPFDVSEAGLERYFLPAAADPPAQDLACAQPGEAALPKIWQEMNSRAASDDVDCQKMTYLERKHEWTEPETIATYNRSADVSEAGSLCAKLGGTVTSFVNHFCGDISRDFEGAERRQRLKEMNACIADCKSKTLARFGVFASADIMSCMGDEVLQEAESESISPAVELGLEEVDRVRRFAENTEKSGSPFMFLSKLYQATSFVAVLGSTRFGAWLLFKLLTDYVAFRRRVWDLGYRLFTFEAAGLNICFSEAGNGLKFKLLNTSVRLVCAI